MDNKNIQYEDINFHKQINNLVKINLSLSELLFKSSHQWVSDSKQQAQQLAALVRQSLQVKQNLIGLQQFLQQLAHLKHKAIQKLSKLNVKINSYKNKQLEQQQQQQICNTMSVQQMQDLLSKVIKPNQQNVDQLLQQKNQHQNQQI